MLALLTCCWRLTHDCKMISPLRSYAPYVFLESSNSEMVRICMFARKQLKLYEKRREEAWVLRSCLSVHVSNGTNSCQRNVSKGATVAEGKKWRNETRRWKQGRDPSQFKRVEKGEQEKPKCVWKSPRKRKGDKTRRQILLRQEIWKNIRRQRTKEPEKEKSTRT